jgi:hypothetical protein
MGDVPELLATHRKHVSGHRLSRASADQPWWEGWDGDDS